MELAKEAEKYVAADRLESARVLLNKAKAEFLSGRYKASLKGHEEALRVFEEEYSLEDVARALYGISVAYSFNEGLREKSISHILRTIALCQELEDFRGQMEGLRAKRSDFFQWRAY